MEINGGWEKKQRERLGRSKKRPNTAFLTRTRARAGNLLTQQQQHLYRESVVVAPFSTRLDCLFVRYTVCRERELPFFCSFLCNFYFLLRPLPPLFRPHRPTTHQKKMGGNWVKVGLMKIFYGHPWRENKATIRSWNASPRHPLFPYGRLTLP